MVALGHALSGLAPGTRVCADFVVERLTRRGPLAEVYTARSHSRPDEWFQVRLLRRTRAGSAAAFRGAMETVQGIQHRAISPVVAFAMELHGPIVVTRWMGEASLRQVLGATPGPTHGDVGWVISEVASALDVLHGMHPPVIHRAVCPENISMTRLGGPVWLEECGLAHAMDAAGWLPGGRGPARESDRVFRDDLLHRMDTRYDIRVLASVAYECLVGTRALQRADCAGIRAAILDGVAPPIREVHPDLSADVETALVRASGVERDAAYESASAFAMDLAQGLMSPVPPQGHRLPSMKPGRSGMRPSMDRGSVVLAGTPATPELPETPETVLDLDEGPDIDLAFDDLVETNDAPPPPVPRVRAMTPPPPPPTLAALGPDTIEPPSAYPQWAGTVSRRDAPEAGAAHAWVTAPRASTPFIPLPPRTPANVHAPDPDDSGVRPTPLDLASASIARSPVHSEARPDQAPAIAALAERATPGSLPPPVAKPNAVPVAEDRVVPGVVRELAHTMSAAEGPTYDALLAALPSVGVRSATILGMALIVSALIVTSGVVYTNRHPHEPAHPTRSVTASPRVTAPPVTAPAPLPAAPAPALALAPLPVALALAPAPPPAAPVVAAPVPVLVAPAPDAVPAQEPALAGTNTVAVDLPQRPDGEELAAVRAQLRPLAVACAGLGFAGRHVRFGVRYEGATGLPVAVTLRGLFTLPPQGPCIERAARGVPLHPFRAGHWDEEYVFRASDE